MKNHAICSRLPVPAARHRLNLTVEAALALFASDLVACGVLRRGRLLHATPALRKRLGVTAQRDVDFLRRVADEDRARVRAALEEPHARGKVSLQCSCIGAHGELFPAEIGLSTSTLDNEPVRLMVLADLTERVAAENRLRAAAHYDALTELPNRVLLQDRLSHALAMATRNQRLMALIVADLDGFKAVNDANGHAAGDAALREVARRFSACVRDADTLARVGGDEFVIVLPELARREDAALLAMRLVKSMRAPFEIDGATFSLGASVGIAIYPDDGADIDTLFLRADAAMYRSKQSGRNQFSYADVSDGTFMAPQACGWSEQWQFGVDEMDDEHHALFDWLGRLETTLRDARDREQIRAELHALVAYATDHFNHEERLMEAAGFAGLSTHRAEHHRLSSELAELAEHTHRVGATMTIRFLRDWLIGHMQGYDRAAAHAICGARAH